MECVVLKDNVYTVLRDLEKQKEPAAFTVFYLKCQEKIAK